MTVKGISHIGVAVKDLNTAREFFEKKLGLKAVHESGGNGFLVAFMASETTPIELIQDEIPGGTITKFIEKRGEGVHHICFEVEDVRSAMETLQSQGVHFASSEPRRGAYDALEVFVHPKDSHGVLIQLAEFPKDTDPGKG
jgi:methylmalonyl-CoA/ethylmalonyl-CoA epimerase